jgi:hypothetical protein
MNNLVVKKEAWIENKILTKDDVISLCRLFIKLSNEISDKAKEIKRKQLIQKAFSADTIEEIIKDSGHSDIEITASDNSKFTGSFDQISGDEEFFVNKKITEILLVFYENVLEIKLAVNLKHSHSAKGYILVRGLDGIWVNETIGLVEKFFSNCRNQSTSLKKYKILIITSIILTLNFFLINLIEIFIRTKVIFPKLMDKVFSDDLIFVIIIISFITVTPAVYFYGWLKNLFPGIEIQTRKDFQQAEKEKRMKLWIIGSIIIIPTIISFIIRLLIN